MAERSSVLLLVTAIVLIATFFLARRRTTREPPSAPDNALLHRRTLLHVVAVMTMLLGGLLYRLLYVSLIGAREVSDRSGQDSDGETLSNVRQASEALAERRGAILDRDGDVLVRSVDRGGWVREIEYESAPHLLGYFSPLRFGLSGLEASRDGDLAGTDPLTVEEAARSLLFRENADGHDVVTTINRGLQSLAAEMLGGVVGSATLISVRTGEVLAMASSPGFDTAALVTNDSTDADRAGDAWEVIAGQPNQPLLFRATTGLYPPGSTFKVLTAAAAIDAGLVQDSSVFTDDGSFEIEGRVIPEFNRPDPSRDQWTVREGLVWSLNVVYAQIGLELGADRFRRYAADFGIGREIPFEFGVEPGQSATDPADLDNRVALADTAFGQGALLVTPLHMARVMMAVAGGGRILRPQLVREIRDSQGEPIWTFEPKVETSPISRSSADTVLDLLYDSVRLGYAANAAIPGLRVAGKTGTAESGQDAPHGWFIGCAGVDEPEVVVSVCLDYWGDGGGYPLQIGRALLEAAVNR